MGTVSKELSRIMVRNLEKDIENASNTEKELDKYYRGLDEMDWDNDEDRIAMVKDGNFNCSYEFEPDDCETCPAKQWCDRY